MRDQFIFALVILIAIAYIYNEWQKWEILQSSANSHIVTNEQLVEFVSKGDRFTASDGIKLCEILSDKEVDCEALFRR